MVLKRQSTTELSILRLYGRHIAETHDDKSYIDGQHITPNNLFVGLEAATSGPVVTGSVGCDAGMVHNGFKGGIGTALRVVYAGDQSFTEIALVQCIFKSHSNISSR